MRRSTEGWINGSVGVIIFSASLPATRIAVGGFSPIFLTSLRAIVAAALGSLLLLLWREKRPALRDLGALVTVAFGVVVGFPLFTAMALEQMTSAHSIVFIGLLPLATAVFGAWRGGERPRKPFWICATLGSVAVGGFALSQGTRASVGGDLLMVAAIIVCGLGYAEGAILSRRLGGWQVISWALVLSLPVMLAVASACWPTTWQGIETPAWLGLAYVSIFSMLIGFIFWYRGLALGGIAGISQLQLLQPFLGLALAGWLLGEPVSFTMIAASGLVVLCVLGAKRYA